MKRFLPVLLSLLILCGCGAPADTVPAATDATPTQPQQAAPVIQDTPEIPYESRFQEETLIQLSDAGMDVTGPNIPAVYSSNDIIYYEDRDTYESGNPYGEGTAADKGSFIHGGTVIAMGAAMDWAESDSDQITMNLQFTQRQTGAIAVTAEDGTSVFSFDPAADPVLKDHNRGYQGLVVSCPNFKIGDSYEVTVDGTKMMYTSTDVMRGPGGFGGGFGGQMPGGMGQRPEGGMPDFGGGEMPDGFEGGFPGGFDGEMPEDFDGSFPEGFEGNFGGQMPGNFGGEIPEGFDGNFPENFDGELPEGFDGQMPGGFGGQNGDATAESGTTLFYMQDKVNFFSGLTAAK